MTTQSRIKFNPLTKDIEIEGSEAFVKTYFGKIQALLTGVTEAPEKAKKSVDAAEAKPAKVGRRGKKKADVQTATIVEVPIKKARRSKKAVKAPLPAKPMKRGDKMNAVMGLIQSSPEGMTTTELKDQTGLTEKQIWAVIYRGEKMGKIRKEKRGLYIAI
ncbi:MAG: hypothetical protein CSYNP_03612 [Syntrophus sp. SKADARSKE-3]|nr:hypothetical protein [Syntrophus sp. SKADARSKE-3]